MKTTLSRGWVFYTNLFYEVGCPDEHYYSICTDFVAHMLGIKPYNVMPGKVEVELRKTPFKGAKQVSIENNGYTVKVSGKKVEGIVTTSNQDEILKGNGLFPKFYMKISPLAVQTEAPSEPGAGEPASRQN